MGILPLITGYGMAADPGSVGDSQFKYSLESCNSLGILIIEGLSGFPVLHGIRFKLARVRDDTQAPRGDALNSFSRLLILTDPLECGT